MTNLIVLVATVAFAMFHYMMFPTPLTIERDTRKLAIMFGCTLLMLVHVFLYDVHVLSYWEMVAFGAIIWFECLARPLMIVMLSVRKVRQ